MKKITYLFLGSLTALLCQTSCYDDNSTLATENIGNVGFDGNQTELYIGFQETLKVAPSLQLAEGTAVDALTYEWALTETYGSTNNEYEIIGTEQELNWIMDRPIASAPYTLKLTITDTAHDDLKYIYAWKVYVQSSFLDGLLICDTQDGQTSDLTLINNSSFTVNYSKEEHIFRNMLTTATGAPYDGLIQTLVYQLQGSMSSTHTNQVWALTDRGDCVRFKCVDYSVNGRMSDESLFVDQAAGMQVYSIFKSYQDIYALTNNSIYSVTPTNANRFNSPTNSLKTYRVSNNVVANSPNTSYSANYLVSYSNNHANFYDDEKGQFITLSGMGTFTQVQTFAASMNFDPNNLPGQTAVAGVVFEDATQVVFLLKDNASGNYSIYTLSTYVSEDGYYLDPDNWSGWTVITPEQPAAAKSKYAIPAEGKTLLDKAISVFFSNKNLVLYVATSEGIYAINYGAGTTATVATTAKFAPSGGETVVKAKMYQQGIYLHDLGAILGSYATVPELPLSNNSVMVATQTSANEGKVYVIPITQAAAGTLDASQAKIYTGFGKILDMTGTGY